MRTRPALEKQLNWICVRCLCPFVTVCVFLYVCSQQVRGEPLPNTSYFNPQPSVLSTRTQFWINKKGRGGTDAWLEKNDKMWVKDVKLERFFKILLNIVQWVFITSWNHKGFKVFSAIPKNLLIDLLLPELKGSEYIKVPGTCSAALLYHRGKWSALNTPSLSSAVRKSLGADRK